MNAARLAGLMFVGLSFTAGAAEPSVKLPDHYFGIMEAELSTLPANDSKSNPGAMLAAAVLYAREHPANPSRGETARTKIELDAARVDLTPDRIGGWIRHRGWTLRVDPAARLTWPVRPFNPYSNGPEKELRHAVGVLSVPVSVQPPPADAALNWRRGEIAFELEARQAP
jgi:hypothetical protein